MRKRCVAILLAGLFLLFASCSPETELTPYGTDSTLIYRVLKPSYQTNGELIRAELYDLQLVKDKTSRVLELFFQAPRDNHLQLPFPEEVRLISYFVNEGEILLNLSDGYLDMTPMEQSIANYCLTFTLCSLDKINTVSVAVDGQGISMGMTAQDAILYDTNTDPYEKQVRLYFTDESGRYLGSERRSLTVDDDNTSLERYVIEELLRGPNSDSLYASVPQGTQLLSAATSQGACTVNFTGESWGNMPPGHLTERLAVFSVVNSLTSLSGVDSVKILVEGSDKGVFEYFSAEEPLSRNEHTIGPINTARGEYDVDICLPLTDGVQIALVPRIITWDGFEDLEYVILESLITGGGEPGYSTPFTAGDLPNSVSNVNGLCTVDLPESFFSSREDADDIQRAIDILVATLSGLDGINSVRLKLDGGPATYKDKSFSSNIYANKDIILY